MARYDLPTYVLHVLGHFWMFAKKKTEWIFSLKSLGLLTWTCTHLPIVWDKVPNKFGFFLTPSLIAIVDGTKDTGDSWHSWKYRVSQKCTFIIAVGNHSVHVPKFQDKLTRPLERWHIYGVISHSNHESAFILGHPVDMIKLFKNSGLWRC